MKTYIQVSQQFMRENPISCNDFIAYTGKQRLKTEGEIKVTQAKIGELEEWQLESMLKNNTVFFKCETI
jgi:hypothetical protein